MRKFNIHEKLSHFSFPAEKLQKHRRASISPRKSDELIWNMRWIIEMEISHKICGVHFRFHFTNEIFIAIGAI